MLLMVPRVDQIMLMIYHGSLCDWLFDEILWFLKWTDYADDGDSVL